MDQALIGSTVAALMDVLDEREGKLAAVALAVVVDEGDTSYTLVQFSQRFYHEQIGLLTSAGEVVAADKADDDPSTG